MTDAPPDAEDTGLDSVVASGLEYWTARFGDIPAEHRGVIDAYLTEIAGIPDLFDGLDADDLRQIACDVLQEKTSPAVAVDGFVRAHLGYLGTWRDALDQLDADLRDGHGRLPDWAAPMTCGVARDLFDADSAMKNAVIEFHHGSVGPYLNPAYGYEYCLSNGYAGPFRTS